MPFPLVPSLAVPEVYFIYIIPLFMGLGFLFTTLLLIVKAKNSILITLFVFLAGNSVLISPSLEILALTLAACALGNSTAVLTYYYIYIWRHKNKEK